jgi:hypothetical protein
MFRYLGMPNHKKNTATHTLAARPGRAEISIFHVERSNPQCGPHAGQKRQQGECRPGQHPPGWRILIPCHQQDQNREGDQEVHETNDDSSQWHDQPWEIYLADQIRIIGSWTPRTTPSKRTSREACSRKPLGDKGPFPSVGNLAMRPNMTVRTSIVIKRRTLAPCCED